MAGSEPIAFGRQQFLRKEQKQGTNGWTEETGWPYAGPHLNVLGKQPWSYLRFHEWYTPLLVSMSPSRVHAITV